MFRAGKDNIMQLCAPWRKNRIKRKKCVEKQSASAFHNHILLLKTSCANEFFDYSLLAVIATRKKKCRKVKLFWFLELLLNYYTSLLLVDFFCLYDFPKWIHFMTKTFTVIRVPILLPLRIMAMVAPRQWFMFIMGPRIYAGIRHEFWLCSQPIVLCFSTNFCSVNSNWDFFIII